MELDVRETSVRVTKVRFADDAYVDISKIDTGEVRIVNEGNDEEGFSIVINELDAIIKALTKIKEINSK